ncbi:MAG: elongation factor G [Acidobacteriota bacterium]|jgi:elongation factor G|nr:elongation factor G [Acidobacteriota bacterium]NLT34241.1 elongation factor G [Acidobacteriota bacterium]
MRVFESDSIRNICIIGHGAAGKTSLTSAILFDSGAVNRLGRVEDGNTVTDWEDEEIERKISISCALAHCEWNKKKINILDTPGYRPFLAETRLSVRAADAAVVVVDAVAGVEVQTEKVWEFCDEYSLPRMIVINKADRDNASSERTLASLEEEFGRGVVPLEIPMGMEKEFTGVISLLTGRAYRYERDGSGKFQEMDVPAQYEDELAERREKLIEMVAEGSDALMERFFAEGTLNQAEILEGLRIGVKQGDIRPVFYSSATLNIGIPQILDAVTELFPSPAVVGTTTGTDPKTGESIERKISNEEPYAAYVFKTIADPFAGRISLIKLYSGIIRSDTVYNNQTKEKNEKLGPLQILQGKTMTPIEEVHAGDFFAVTKLRETTTGDTLCDPAQPILFSSVELPEPSITFAIEPKSRGDEDKISHAMSRIIEEDGAIRYTRDPQTKQLLLAGSDQLHVEVTVSKLRKRYGVEVLLKTPRIPYRETIRGKADVQGRHKKQTGGHGQFGDCWIRMEPLPRGGNFEFVDEIFGGAIPRNFIPAVEKGILEAAERGYLAGNPVVDFKVTLYDGSFHPVDSSEMAFKIAGRIAFKKAMEMARPVLLEPVMDVEIYAPQEYAGALTGDLSSRRGRLQGMDIKHDVQIIKAQVPMAEMVTYSPVLTSMTGGRGSYSMQFSHYDEVPAQIAQKIIEESSKDKKEEEE